MSIAGAGPNISIRNCLLIAGILGIFSFICASAAPAILVRGSSSRVIYAGETISLSLQVDNRNQPAMSSVTLECELIDFHGIPMTTLQSQFALSADSIRLSTLSSSANEPGYFSVVARLRVGGAVVSQNDQAWSVAVLDQPRTFPQDSPLGVYSIGNTGMLADIVPRGFYSDMVKGGARWGTIDVWWSLLEPVDDAYNWDYYDVWFQSARDTGLVPMPHLFGTPQWVSSQQPGEPLEYWRYPPNDLNKWRQFVHDFVDRYKDWLDYLRIWNEPNVRYWMGTPAEYAQLVIAASQEAKAVKPGIKIIIEAVDDVHHQYGVYPFFNALHVAGATPHWDVLAIHNYWLNNANPPERTQFAYRYQMLSNWRDAYKPGAEIWDTEFGCMSESWENGFWIGVGETKQAQWLARAHALGFSRGLTKMIWFPGYSWPAPETTPPYYNPAGLLRADLSPKPAYVAYHAMAIALSEASFLEELANMPLDRHAMVFQRGDGYVTLLWSVDDAHAGPVPLTFPADLSVEISDLMGKSKVTELNDYAGLTLNVDENMQYVYSSSRPVFGLLPVELSSFETE